MTNMSEDKLTKDQARKQADLLLLALRDSLAGIRRLEGEFSRKKKRLEDIYAKRILLYEDLRQRVDAELKALMKKDKDALFGEEDVVYLTNGQLTFAVARPIAYPRKKGPLIEALEEQGFAEVVKVEKSYDRDALDQWPDDQLALVGLKRKKPEEVFDYTLKEAPCPDKKAK